MISRCTNPKLTNWHRYGGRGITVCDRWLNGDSALSGFQCFLEDMGRRPGKGHSIDRIDNDGPYSKENCRWSNRIQQARNRHTNRRVTHNGETKPLAEWAHQHNIDPTFLWKRLNRGWPVDKALTTPSITSTVITHNGRTQNFRQWAKETGMAINTIRHRLNPLGWSVERALTTPVRAAHQRPRHTQAMQLSDAST